MDASSRKVSTPHGGWFAVAISVAVAIAVSVATWFVLYRWAGYGTTTRIAAHLAFIVAALALAAWIRIPMRSLGLTFRAAGETAAVPTSASAQHAPAATNGPASLEPGRREMTSHALS